MNWLNQPINLRRLPLATLIGAMLGLIANLIVYFAARAAGFEFLAPAPPTNEPMPLPVVAVIVSTVVPAIGAAIILVFLNRFSARPLRAFLIIAAVVLVISFAGPFTLPISFIERMILNVMHIIAAAAIIWALVRFTAAQ